MYLKRYPVFSCFLVLLSIFVYYNFTSFVPIKHIDKSSHYVNELYVSDDFVYNKLDNREKKMYDMIFDTTKNYKSSTTISNIDYDCQDGDDCSNLCLKAFYAVLVEHPEMINMASASWTYDEYNLNYNNKSATINKHIDKLAIERIKRDVYRIKLETDKLSDIDKIKYVYDYIGKNKYDDLFTGLNKNQSIYNVFINHNAVCSGFAKASQVIFQNIGINSYIVRGTSGGEHMWNIVEVDGKWYNYDSTVAVSTNNSSSRHYLGLSQNYLSKLNSYYPEWYPTVSNEEIFTK